MTVTTWGFGCRSDVVVYNPAASWPSKKNLWEMTSGDEDWLNRGPDAAAQLRRCNNTKINQVSSSHKSQRNDHTTVPGESEFTPSRLRLRSPHRGRNIWESSAVLKEAPCEQVCVCILDLLTHFMTFDHSSSVANSLSPLATERNSKEAESCNLRPRAAVIPPCSCPPLRPWPRFEYHQTTRPSCNFMMHLYDAVKEKQRLTKALKPTRHKISCQDLIAGHRKWEG